MWRWWIILGFKALLSLKPLLEIISRVEALLNYVGGARIARRLLYHQRFGNFFLPCAPPSRGRRIGRAWNDGRKPGRRARTGSTQKKDRQDWRSVLSSCG